MERKKCGRTKMALLVLLIATMSLALLVGCGSGTNSGSVGNAATQSPGAADVAADEEKVHFTVTAQTNNRKGSFSPETRARLDLLLNTITVEPPLGSSSGYFTILIETTMESEVLLGDDIVVEISIDRQVNDIQALAAQMLRQLNDDTAFTALYSVLIRNDELRIETKFLHDNEELNIIFK